jgi:hypothetical protein
MIQKNVKYGYKEQKKNRVASSFSSACIIAPQTCVVQWFQGCSKNILALYFVFFNLDGLRNCKSYICKKLLHHQVCNFRRQGFQLIVATDPKLTQL